MPAPNINKLRKDSFFSPDSVPIVVARREPQPAFPRHRHQFSELIIITGGTGVHAIRNEEYPVSAGDVFTIGDNSPHEYRDMKKLGLVNILYDPDQLEMSKWDLRTLPGYHALFTFEPAYRRQHKFASRLRLTMVELSEIKQLVAKLENELDAQKPGFKLMALSLFMNIVCVLSRCYEQSREPVSQALLRIGEAISYMEDNWSRNITNEILANIAHMSERNFSRIFLGATGRSPTDYLIRLRISRASEILIHSDLNVTEIAFRCGFDDSNYFARQFRKVIGLSPREYRKSRSA